MKKFAFITNIIETEDIRLEGFYPHAGKIIPLSIWNFALRYLLGNKRFPYFRKKGYHLVASYNICGVQGHTVLVLLTSEQIKKDLFYARRRVFDACRFAEDELGVDLIGLGSLTKSIVNGGDWLKKQGIKVAITHGDSYTVAVAQEGILKVAKAENLARSFTIGIAGAYGRIGRALAEILCQEEISLVLMGRRMNFLNKMKAQEPFLNSSRVVFTDSLKQMLDYSDIAVMATSAPESIIAPEHLKLGKTYLIYDVGQPNNLGQNRYLKLLKQGFNVKRFDGAIVEPPPGANIGFNMRLRPDRQYACFAETVLQTIIGDRQDHIDEKIKMEHIYQTKKWAELYGFHHAPLECFLNPV